MKKLIIFITGLLFIAIVSSVSAEPQFIWGGVAKGKVYEDNSKDFMFGQVVGVGVDVESVVGNFPLSPDEVYIVYTFGRSKNDSAYYVSVHEATLKGLYYFNQDTLSKFNPFFHLAVAYEATSSEDGSENLIAGTAGLGFGYQINRRVATWLAGGVKTAGEITGEVGAGLKFNAF